MPRHLASPLPSSRTAALVLGAATLAASSSVEARSFRQSQLPRAPSGCNTCHTSGGGTPRNVFGQDVQRTLVFGNVDWPRVCAMDSDGDGASNGAELADPNCSWRMGDPAPSGTTYDPADSTVFPPAMDAGVPDTGAPDLGPPDTGAPDLGPPDTGAPDLGPPDTGAPDLGPPDTGAPDLGPPDVGAPDLGTPDTGAPDLGPLDAGPSDLGSPDVPPSDAGRPDVPADGGGGIDLGRPDTGLADTGSVDLGLPPADAGAATDAGLTADAGTGGAPGEEDEGGRACVRPATPGSLRSLLGGLFGIALILRRRRALASR